MATTHFVDNTALMNNPRSHVADNSDSKFDIKNAQPPLMDLNLLGLDPLSDASFKLFIKDINSLENMDTDLVSLHGHMVSSVEIMGIIVRVDLKDSRHTYAVDDGTGVIVCHLWRTFKDFQPMKVNCLPLSLLEKQEQMVSVYDSISNGFDIGDLICVYGRVIHYRGQKEIDVDDIFKLDDPNKELERVLELSILYDKYYCNPFSPQARSQDIKTSVGSLSSDSKKYDSIRLKDILLSYLEENVHSLTDFLVEETYGWPIFNLAFHNDNFIPDVDSISSALAAISETKGLIYKKHEVGKNSSFEVIRDGCGLCQEIMKITAVLCQGGKCQNGLHLNQILTALKQSSLYSNAPQIVVQKCLECLENSSDIFKVDKHRFLPIIL